MWQAGDIYVQTERVAGIMYALLSEPPDILRIRPTALHIDAMMQLIGYTASSFKGFSLTTVRMRTACSTQVAVHLLHVGVKAVLPWQSQSGRAN